MLKQTFYNRYKGWGEKPPSNAMTINVTRSAGYLLSPSYELLMDYKNKRINWDQYVVRFKKEMYNDACRTEMMRIKDLSKVQDVYLVCVCWNKDKKCHRYLLIDMIEKMCRWCGEQKKVSTGLCSKCCRF